MYIGKISGDEYLKSRNFLGCNLSTPESFRTFYSRSLEIQLIMLKSTNHSASLCRKESML